MRKTIIITGISAAFIVFFIYSLLNKGNANLKKSIQTTIQKINAAGIKNTPAPFPFQEITIPYLRNREYKSVLGPKQKSYETDEYTAYLTSYDSDGLKINGILTEPKSLKPNAGWPAIVFLHGYIPPTLYQTEKQYYDYVDYLASAGFVVFKIDLRGHADSDGEATGAYFSGDYIIDTLNAYAALEKADFVNPQKIGLWGHSMAGNVVLRAMAVKSTIPAAVIWAGAGYTYADMQKYGIDDNSYRPPAQTTQRQGRRQRIRDLYGEYSASSAFWRQMAATNYLHDLKGAIKLNHAIDDMVVNIGYSRDLNSRLNLTSIPHELNEYESGGHNISGNSFNAAMANTTSFFKKYLK